MSNKSIIDLLVQDEDRTTIEKEDIYIPQKCQICNNTIICNILPAAIGFAQIGIKISIDECPYHNKAK